MSNQAETIDPWLSGPGFTQKSEQSHKPMITLHSDHSQGTKGLSYDLSKHH